MKLEIYNMANEFCWFCHAQRAGPNLGYKSADEHLDFENADDKKPTQVLRDQIIPKNLKLRKETQDQKKPV